MGMIGDRLIRGTAGVAMVLASLEEARGLEVPTYERRVFRIANDAPDAIRIPVRAVMQAGTFVTVPIVALVAGATGRRHLAVDLAAAGTLAWLGAKSLKPLAGRGRPESLLPDVHVRERIAGDLGWVSGHAAVATTLAATAWPVLPQRRDPPWSPSWRPQRSVACTWVRTFPSTSSAASASASSCPRWCPAVSELTT